MNYKALATLMLLTSLGWSHDFWLKPAPQGAILRYGHGSEEEPYKSEKLKKASALAHGLVFFADAGVLDGHLPSRKVDHLGPRFQVTVIEAGPNRAHGTRGLAHSYSLD